MSKRAIRRHHAARIRRQVERWIRSHTRPDSWQDRWEWKYDEQGKPVSHVNYLVPDWREKFEEHVRIRVYRESSHRPHFCQMCRRPRWNRRKDDRYDGEGE